MNKMLFYFIGLIFFIFGFSTALAEKSDLNSVKTIGIVLPLDHVALRAIVAGFEETVSQQYPGKVKFEVDNAEHDLNIQRSIIQKFMNQKVDLIIPVATAPTLMAIAMVKNQPVLGLAAMVPDSVRQKPGMENRVTAVRDEINSSKQMDFMRAILPNVKKVTLIYSADDKVIPEANNAIAVAKQAGIQVQPLMIQALSDLYSASRRIDKDSQAIFILKDNLVASGVNTLVMIANSRHIPLITSDEGTVASGAATALGVEEKQIGIEGGKLAVKILNGQPLKELPIQEMSQLMIFINTQAASAQGLNIDVIKNYAQQQHFDIRLNPVPQ
jgi:putative tryptophan/tyrosine transport system substrate-binding protein